jgi:Asp-tRNA(Asn)/Glu-tRNA(Gln) amidotransferase A subunit family amidase
LSWRDGGTHRWGLLDEYDALICPTFTIPAFGAPSGLSRDGVPTGLSVIAPTYAT